MTDLLFETPWWLPAGLVIFGAILFLTGNRRGANGLRNVGLGTIVLGIAIALVSYLVETDKERVTRRSHELVELAAKQDWKAVEALMSPDVQFDFAGRHYGDRTMLIAAARAAAADAGLRSAYITAIELSEEGMTMIVRMRIFSDQDRTGGQPLPSDWQLEWHKTAGHWLITDIRLLQIGQLK